MQVTPAPAPQTALSDRRTRVTVETGSTDETRSLAAALAGVACPGDRIAVSGPLGAGKTQFAKGFARGLGITDVVSSPSFTLMAEYAGRLPFFHQDLYRLAGSADAIDGGLLDERQDQGVTLAEWAERLAPELDAERLVVQIEITGELTRAISLMATVPSLQRYVDAAERWRAVHLRG
jgi:tRNA threonylcarbamoyladenosine biosynthesis protein TsaE